MAQQVIAAKPEDLGSIMKIYKVAKEKGSQSDPLTITWAHTLILTRMCVHTKHR